MKSTLSNIHIGVGSATGNIYVYRARKELGLMGEKRECENEVMQAIISQFEVEKISGKTFTLNGKQYELTLKPINRTTEND